jgi:hypothetical protein
MHVGVGVKIQTSAFEDDPVLPEPGNNDLLMAMNLSVWDSVLPMPDATINADELALLTNAYDWSA